MSATGLHMRLISAAEDAHSSVKYSCANARAGRDAQVMGFPGLPGAAAGVGGRHENRVQHVHVRRCRSTEVHDDVRARVIEYAVIVNRNSGMACPADVRPALEGAMREATSNRRHASREREALSRSGRGKDARSPSTRGKEGWKKALVKVHPDSADRSAGPDQGIYKETVSIRQT